MLFGMGNKLSWQIALGVCGGLLAAGAVERVWSAYEARQAMQQLDAQMAAMLGGSTARHSDPGRVASARVPLAQDQRCLAGTVVVYGAGGRSVVQLLESGRPVRCEGGYRDP